MTAVYILGIGRQGFDFNGLTGGDDPDGYTSFRRPDGRPDAPR